MKQVMISINVKQKKILKDSKRTPHSSFLTLFVLLLASLATPEGVMSTAEFNLM